MLALIEQDINGLWPIVCFSFHTCAENADFSISRFLYEWKSVVGKAKTLIWPGLQIRWPDVVFQVASAGDREAAREQPGDRVCELREDGDWVHAAERDPQPPTQLDLTSCAKPFQRHFTVQWYELSMSLPGGSSIVYYFINWISGSIGQQEKLKSKGKTLTEKWRDLWRKGTHKHLETYLKYFDCHRCLSQSEKKTSLIPEMYQITLSVPFLRRSLHFSVRVFPFFSNFFCYPYFDTFLSKWSGSIGERRMTPTWLMSSDWCRVYSVMKA